MKKLVFLSLVVIGISIASCGSEMKNDGNTDSVTDTSMSASPGLDTNGVGTDTTGLDSMDIDTTDMNLR